MSKEYEHYVLSRIVTAEGSYRPPNTSAYVRGLSNGSSFVENSISEK